VQNVCNTSEPAQRWIVPKVAEIFSPEWWLLFQQVFADAASFQPSGPARGVAPLGGALVRRGQRREAHSLISRGPAMHRQASSTSSSTRSQSGFSSSHIPTQPRTPT